MQILCVLALFPLRDKYNWTDMMVDILYLNFKVQVRKKKKNQK